MEKSDGATERRSDEGVKVQRRKCCAYRNCRRAAYQDYRYCLQHINRVRGDMRRSGFLKPLPRGVEDRPDG